MIKKNIKYIIGIEEVGRGPLAGPVAVCAFKIPAGILPRQIEFLFDWGGVMFTKKSGRIKDSKKLKPKEREEIFEKLKVIKKTGEIDYFVSYESAKRIDKIGISKAIKNCLEKSLTKLKIKPATPKRRMRALNQLFSSSSKVNLK